MKYCIPLLCLLCLYACDAPPPSVEVASGRVERIPDFPSKHITPRNVDVWLPDGYNAAQAHNVLYLHDGQMLFDSTRTWNGQEWGVDETMERLIAAGEIPPTIVVGVWNVDSLRHADYFPQKPFEALPAAQRDSLLGLERQPDHKLFGVPVQSDAYLRFLVEELKPYIDAQYATRPGREHTFVMGSSMGGLISMYALCEYPGVFGGAACLSTHWPGVFSVENNPVPGQFFAYLDQHLPDPATHRLYFDFGTETLDAGYEPLQRRADSIVSAHGFSVDNWLTRKFPGADHSENAWRARLAVPLKFLLE